MQPELVTQLPRGSEWRYEAKLDGNRAQAVRNGEEINLYSRHYKSRHHNTMNALYPEIIDDLRSVACKSCVIDGEVVALDESSRPSLKLLQTRSKTAPLRYFAFDLLQLNGKDLCGKPYQERKVMLEELIRGSAILPVPSLAGDPDRIAAEIKRLGFEGVVAKRLGSEYISGKQPRDWQKIRFIPQQNLIIVGYIPTAISLRSFILAYYENRKLRYAGMVERGMTSFQKKQFLQIAPKIKLRASPFSKGSAAAEFCESKVQWVKPLLVAEVKFQRWSKSGHIRQASFLEYHPEVKAVGVRREEVGSELIKY